MAKALGPGEAVAGEATVGETHEVATPLLRRYSKVLDPVPVVQENATPAVIEENFRRIRDHAKITPSPQAYAELVNGLHIELDLIADSGGGFPVGDDGDSLIRHGLGRIPTAIVQAIDLDGRIGQVRGGPAGGNGASGSNENRWTEEVIYVRTDRSSKYSLVVV